MENVRDRALFTKTLNRLDDLALEPGCAYVFGRSPEERSSHSSDWEAQQTEVQFVRVTLQERERAEVDVAGRSIEIHLRSDASLEQFWMKVGKRVVYLDFTGLDHNVWARLVWSALRKGLDLRVVYVEPREYAYSDTPTEGVIFDLSERISGVDALPGFAFLSRGFVEDFVFIPLLGFEGIRFGHLLERVQPPGDRTVPIVGVPGFRSEYPFHTFWGNKGGLLGTRGWKNVRYARANCPFSAFYVLGDIGKRWPHEILTIAPIGTKPHALGVILYYLSTQRAIEIVYDHPKRKAGRTVGGSRTSVYFVSRLFPTGIARIE